MPSYRPPLRDLAFVLHEVLDAGTAFKAMPAHADLDDDTLQAVLAEAGRFCAEVVAPLNRAGDREGCRLDPASHQVTTPAGFADAYRQYVAGGWPSLSCDPDFGGQGLPVTINQALYEMLNSASQSWTMYPGLSHGAYDCLHAHGTAAQRALYLPKLVSGEWTGTMCLTESHSGTDLGLLRTRAEPLADGSWRLNGEKIFISAGEHDLSANIVHLVLARMADAPPGSRGISLFVVPKFLVEADGTPGARNGIWCGGLEHKMGIHGNATCQMVLQDAIGTLVGEPNKGLAAMFVMMNAARLGVGAQSVGLSEVAYQNAAAYARERVQGRSLSGPAAPAKPADPILVHADVRRLLLTARAFAEGGRALLLWTALSIDRSLHAETAEERSDEAERVALLTPIVKAFLTDNGWIATSHCLQVLGGHGYIAEWGMEQFVRDARINMIYEGTNAVQALDLLGRKVLGDGGRRLGKLARELHAFVAECAGEPAMQAFTQALQRLAERLVALTAALGARARSQPEEVGAAAVDYLRICGHLVFAWLWARMARIALARQNLGDPFYTAKLATARFYFARLLPEVEALFVQIEAGPATLAAMPTELF